MLYNICRENVLVWIVRKNGLNAMSIIRMKTGIPSHTLPAYIGITINSRFMITILGANNLFPHIYHKYQVYAANDYFHHKTSDPPFPTLYEYLESTYAKVCVRTEKQIFMVSIRPGTSSLSKSVGSWAITSLVKTICIKAARVAA